METVASPVVTLTTPLGLTPRPRLLPARLGDRPSLGDYMVPDALGVTVSSYYADWTTFRADLDIPPDHPVFGASAGSVVNAQAIPTSKVSWNTACLTGLFYLCRGRPVDLPPGRYDMTASTVTGAKFLPVIWWPAQTPDLGDADGEWGLMLQGGHVSRVILDWSGMGAGLFAGPTPGRPTSSRPPRSTSPAATSATPPRGASSPNCTSRA